MISQDLIVMLRCPESKSKLVLINNRLISTDKECGRAYFIEDGTPVLLIEKSEKLSKEVWGKIILNEASVSIKQG